MRLVIQPAARSDILKQIAYYADLSRDDVAERFLANTRQSFERIADAPHSGAPKHFADVALDGLRSRAIIGFEAMRVFYLVRDDVILVLRVLHARRDIEGILGDDDPASEY
ncbi:type II toxin-antitoxin system RelE/ParE family toxin [Rhizobium sp. BK376]|uniref:type II toxin-antitoxin system RelE/ParE family toxin n=1 Tax=Rhizobium sp. BK376 TaxID=2512149 RepID=UPI00105406E3|nr:type II toxin-antitoxin system RelE/ParE family toxin [Rhizobium sp. BK376]TCR92160.1 toxin ParE1/3/4 [Rhizobium sp. BK376]